MSEETCQVDIPTAERLSVLETEVKHIREELDQKENKESGIDPHIAKLYTKLTVLEEQHRNHGTVIKILLGGIVSMAIWLLKLQLFGIKD